MHILSLSLVTVALLTAGEPDKSDCSAANQQYTATVNKVIEAARAYEKCVSAGDKHSDCSTEMQALDSSHDDFADAVADLKDCK
ncbi:MAG TPA: hypothetical protein VHY35_14745 [Stellaceae bacterium]|jgi:hypothetical protein|nr:hypothetical protein [Stellaceae bacterium]